MTADSDKKTETEHMFPTSTLHACAVRSGKIWKSWRPREQAKTGWISLFCLQTSFVLACLFYQLNLLRYCGIKVNGSKEQPSRFLQVQLTSVWLIRYNHCKLIKLTFFVPFTNFLLKGQLSRRTTFFRKTLQMFFLL